ncbi:oligosaccharide flippase family protein [Pseudogracilibacillus sp. SE30717A]|uniref:oligosaccharide flippase family protein n=1 Tax=Pseudogracilibacillus sp. SE30717A TaxID=3098293 RepID=UPI00300E5791
MSQLKAGALLSYLSIFISIAVALVYTPIMIRILGQSEFGLYSLIGSLAAYFSVMDMGLGNAMVRYTARNRVVGDENKESKLNGLFLILYTFIGLLTVVVGIAVYQSVDALFGDKLSGTQLQSAKIMIIILIINFALSFPLSIFSSIIRAYERFVIDKVVSIVRIVMAPLLILPIIYIGYGAISMVIITTVVNLGCLLFNAFYCFKKISITFSFGKLDTTLLKEILAYSFFVFLAVIVDQIYWQTDQIILGAVKGTVSVAIYAIAMQFVKLYIQFSTSISGLFLPKASMMVARKASSNELTEMMIRYGRLQYIILTLILSGFILFGQPFINIWAGANYSDAYNIVLIIMLPLTIPLIQNIGISILYAKNLQGFRSVMLIIIAVLNVILSIPIARNYGGIGVAYITGATLFFGNVILMNIYYQKKLGINMIAFWKNIVNITVPITISLVIGFLLNILIPQETLLFIAIKICLYIVVHSFLIFKFGFNSYEKELTLSMFKKIKGKLT